MNEFKIKFLSKIGLALANRTMDRQRQGSFPRLHQCTFEIKSGFMANLQEKYLKNLKIEASGWPENCKTEDQKWEFVREYMAREGIELDPSNIELNKVLRMIA
jgi:hypothetical protein